MARNNNHIAGELTNGREIRKAIIKIGTHLITDIEAAEDFLSETSKFSVDS